MAGLKELRRRHGWTREILNWESGVSVDTIRKLEANKPLNVNQRAFAAIVRKLATALGATEEEIANGA